MAGFNRKQQKTHDMYTLFPPNHSNTPEAMAYRNGKDNPDLPCPYNLKSTQYAAWCVGVRHGRRDTARWIKAGDLTDDQWLRVSSVAWHSL